MSISRRRLLAAGGGLSIAALLGAAGCGGGEDDSGSGDSLTVLLPGDVPPGWDAVLAAVNAKLKAELGFTINPQFTAWANYKNQTLLKFTAGESFDTALQARWLSMTQLVASKSLVAVDDLLAGGKYPNLSKTLDPKLIEQNKWSGKLYGIPQVNAAARIQHFNIRQDLAEKHGFGEIADYATLERFWYAVKQKEKNVIPMAVNSNMPDLLISNGQPVGLFNAYSWDNPQPSAQAFSGDSLPFVMALDAKQTGSSRPVPFWEAPGMVDALRAVRRYYLDGIINKDALNVDTSTVNSQFEAGRYASRWAITDGLSSKSVATLAAAVPGARLANVVPFRGGRSAKPYQTFQADNFVVLNAKGSSHEKAMQLEDWLSVKANHDLISYGVEGTDWRPVGSDKFEQVTKYTFPGFALCWRADLELKIKDITESEDAWFTWAKDYDNFTVDPFASFIPDPEPVKREDAQVVAAMTQYANPLFVGAVDVDKGLDALKKALDKAGIAKLQAEMEKQANEYLKGQ
ncbi:ABC transporter substrate-binding protein [Micromonospora sp. CPCC 206061]|uniref:ABC transporter substrate-binding protein n=1 Tax=Micromonospora sp. CPCC 206061 TaxID=3122410 RepID=UPI002FF24878